MSWYGAERNQLRNKLPLTESWNMDSVFSIKSSERLLPKHCVRICRVFWNFYHINSSICICTYTYPLYASCVLKHLYLMSLKWKLHIWPVAYISPGQLRGWWPEGQDSPNEKFLAANAWHADQHVCYIEEALVRIKGRKPRVADPFLE